MVKKEGQEMRVWAEESAIRGREKNVERTLAVVLRSVRWMSFKNWQVRFLLLILMTACAVICARSSAQPTHSPSRANAPEKFHFLTGIHSL
jgi:hypothetical protein